MTTTKTEKNQTYKATLPDVPIPPGGFITENALALALSPREVADGLGMSYPDFGRLLCGDLPITTMLAKKLEKLLGAPAGVWLGLEADYRGVLYRLADLAARPRRKAG
ncbi:MAG: hypothetical protein ABI743_12020 [bacterium]